MFFFNGALLRNFFEGMWMGYTGFFFYLFIGLVKAFTCFLKFHRNICSMSSCQISCQGCPWWLQNAFEEVNLVASMVRRCKTQLTWIAELG